MASPSSSSLGRASGSRSIKHAKSSDSLNSHPLLNSSTSSSTEQTTAAAAPTLTSSPSTDSSRLAPPPPQHIQQSPSDSRPIHSRNASSSSLEGSAAAAGSTPTTYNSLRYAPRQRATPIPFKASQPIFQSHGSAFNHAQAASLSSSPSSGTASPSAQRTSSPSRPAVSSENTNNATLSPPNVNPSDGHANNHTALARAQLNKLKADAQQLKLLPQSFGWNLLEKLQAATDGEWAALAELVSTGEATLLLPQSEGSSSSELSLSDAYDHILLSCSPSRPSPTSAVAAPSLSFSGAKASGVVTLSGLRGTIEDVEASVPPRKRRSKSIEKEAETGKEDETSEKERALSLVFSSFIPRSDSNFIAELRNSRSRVALLSSLAALPRTEENSDQHSQASSTSSNPEVRLSSYSAELALPLPPWTSHGSQRKRSGSASARVANRASTSFASLFGGKDRKGSQSSLPTVNSIETASNDLADSLGETGAAEASPNLSKGNTGSLDAVKDGGSSLEAVEGTSASTSATSTSSDRTISVWVVNKTISRSSILSELSSAVDARMRSKLIQASISPSVLDSISNFSLGFFPNSKSQVSSRSKPAPRAPWQLTPDELSESFQDVLADVRRQLEEAEEAEKEGEASSPTEEEIDRKVEIVESVICSEIYDRIFCPVNSRDAALDDSLASRIAALNVLGLSLQHLGLVIPDNKDSTSSTAEEKEQAALVIGGLSDLIASCGKELQKLQTSSCRSPKDKLRVLVTTHKLVVDGLARLPPVELRKEGEDDPQPSSVTTSKDEQSASSESAIEQSSLKPEAAKSRAPTTSSADLILPILIFAIVSSNPPSLASNLLYIQRFRTESLVRGEASYCLVNMQAAVAFLENVDPPALGLEGAGQILGFESGTEERGHRAKTPSSEIKAANTLSTPEGSFSMPLRIRGRLTQEIGELAGASNGVIRGVLGSSFSAFGRMMGASASVGAETWDQARADGPKTLDDIKSILSGGARLAASPLIRSGSLGTGLGLRDTSAAGMSGAKEMSDIMASKNGSEKTRPEPRTTWSNSSIRNKPAATDYGAEEEISKDRSIPESSSSRDKLSISDRLASISMLSRFGTGERSPNLGTSPLPREKEVPGPPPPFKSSRGAHLPPIRSNSDQTKATSPNMQASRGLASPLGSPMGAMPPPHIPTSLQSPYPPLSSPPTPSRPLHVVLASTGSVASIKIPLIVEELLQYNNVRVQVISTASSLHFFDRKVIKELDQRSASFEEPKEGTEESEEISAQSDYTVADLAAENLTASRGTKPSDRRLPRAHLWSDEDEWNNWSKVGDTILHIELRRWADIVLVAPCSANTLAKITNGICDSLLTSFLRALSPSTPTFLFPAMNTLMYLHPLTSRQISIARELLGYTVVGPIEKRLACGDQGQGAMTEWTDIVNLVVERFHLEPNQVAAGSHT